MASTNTAPRVRPLTQIQRDTTNRNALTDSIGYVLDRPMTVPEVAEFFKVSEKTVYNMINDGQLGCVKIRGTVRVLPRHIDAFLNGEVA